MGIVIVGAGQAGYSHAASLRELGFAGSIVMIGEEPHLPYQRPPLSKAYLLDDFSPERLTFRPREFFDKNGIEVRTGTRAISIDPRARVVELEGGERVSYGTLVLTTGSRPRMLPAGRGMDLPGVHVLRSIENAERLKADIDPGKRVFIAGGGYIGLEIAAACRQRGADVIIVEPADRVLARVAGPATAGHFERIHSEHGVEIRTRVGLERLEGNGFFTRAILSDGSAVEADIAVIGIGGVANVELAAAAGLAVGNGIVVDFACRTSDPHILAAGDCASFPWAGGRIRLESVQNAIDQAAVAAEAVVGRAVAYRPVPWFWSDQYEFKLQTVGLSQGYERILEVPGQRSGSCSIWYFRGEEAIAVDSINDPRTHMGVRKLFSSGATIPYEAVQGGSGLKQLFRSAARPEAEAT